MTLCALVRLLPTVGALVPLQGSSHTKWTSAFWAFVFFLSSMGDHVFFQGGGVSKWLPTFCTIVYFLSTVDEHMCPQVCCLIKRLLTFWTSVGLWSTMSEHVSFENRSLTKRSLTLDTIVCPFFGVGYHVPLQTSWLTKWLLAFWTNVNFVSTWGEGMTRHFSLLWRGTLRTLAFVKLNGLILSSASAKAFATFTFQFSWWTFNWATIFDISLCFHWRQKRWGNGQYWISILKSLPVPVRPILYTFSESWVRFHSFKNDKMWQRKNRHNFRNCSFFVTRGPQTDLLEEVEIFATHEGAPTHLLGLKTVTSLVQGPNWHFRCWDDPKSKIDS